MRHAAKKIYRHSELELWLRRVLTDWERPFNPEELEYGRKLYKDCVIRTLELSRNEAILCAKFDDGREPYCVIDFEGDRFVYRGSDGDDILTSALTVAGMYEIEELVADTFGSVDFLDYDSSKMLDKTVEPAEPDTLVPELWLVLGLAAPGMVTVPVILSVTWPSVVEAREVSRLSR